MSSMEQVLEVMASRHASDVYLLNGSPINIKMQGQMSPMSPMKLTPAHITALLREILSEDKMKEFERVKELNTSVQRRSGVFRISAYVQKGHPAVVIRYIPSEVPDIDGLGVPGLLKKLVLEKRGLVLMVGATGTGKSTTLAAMIEHRNRNMGGHILTIEDPMEFVFRSERSIVSQREVGSDTESLGTALKNALRQAPDLILIGEIRDRETMTAAISYSLSGHLVLATMHCNSSHHALSRILGFYPPEVRETLQNDLAGALKAIVSQRLVRSVAGGRVPAVEVLFNSTHIADLIRKGDFSSIKEAMEKSMTDGSQSFEQDFAQLISKGTISKDEGLAHCDSPSNLTWRLENDFKAGGPASNLPVLPGDPGDGEDGSFKSFDMAVGAAIPA